MAEYSKNSLIGPDNSDGNTSEKVLNSDAYVTEFPEKGSENSSIDGDIASETLNSTPDSMLNPTGKEQKAAKKFNKLGIAVISITAIAGIAIGAVFTLKAGAEPIKNLPPAPDPKATGQTPEASPSSSPESAVETPASPISAEKYTTPEAVVKAATIEANQWIIDGGTEANAIACLNAKVSGDFTENLMAKSDAEFRNQLVVDNWQDIPSLKLYVIHKQEIHRSTTDLAFFTMPNNPYSDYNDQNKEAYKRSEVIDSVQIISQESTRIIARVFAHGNDNSDMNAVLQYTKGVVISTAPYDYGLTMDKVGKNWKISGYAE